MISLSTPIEAQRQTERVDAVFGMNKLFLSESLKLMGPMTAGGHFSGGNAEDQFASFLIDAYAEVLSTKIDLGII